LPESENILRKDTVVEELYKLEITPQPKSKKYLLRVMEFEREHSYFHNFELIKVTHPKELNIGVINNKIIAFKNLILPSSIKDKKGKDWIKELSTFNDKSFFQGEKDNVLNVKFDNIKDLKNCHLVFRASLRTGYASITKIGQKLEKAPSEKKLLDSLKKVAVASLAAAVAAKMIENESVSAILDCKGSINISVIHNIGKQKEKIVDIIHPREKLSLGLADISQHLKRGQKSLSLTLKWTRPHNLSFVGLADVKDLSKTSDVSQEPIELSQLKHLEDRNINKTYLKKGKVELIPGQYIELEFPLEKENVESNQKTSFVLKSKGYYTPL